MGLDIHFSLGKDEQDYSPVSKELYHYFVNKFGCDCYCDEIKLNKNDILYLLRCFSLALLGKEGYKNMFSSSKGIGGYSMERYYVTRLSYHNLEIISELLKMVDKYGAIYYCCDC